MLLETLNLRFMDSAMSRLYQKEYTGTITTDGEWVYYDPVFLLKSYKSAKELPTHIYLHLVFHCVFQHFFVDKEKVDTELWNLACDIAVEATISDLNLKCICLQNDDKRKTELSLLKKKTKYLTAECIYRHLSDGKENSKKIKTLKELFVFDDHSAWYNEGESSDSDSGSGDDNQQTDNSSEEGKTSPQSNNSSNAEDSNGNGSQGSSPKSERKQKLQQDWKNVSESMQTDMETFAKQRGDTAGNLMQNLVAVNREKYDYTSFLKQFAVMGEAMKINDDEFDYIFYTYGLQLFDRKMPLIEPLEYKEVKRIKEFVIAIDTSGSVQGSAVQKFLEKTYNILKQEESFFTKINLHIIQCDADIQEDVKITSQEEFDRYLAEINLKGFGGTDFRPVFDHVDNMVKNHEFTNLKGLIYFTDGWGVFPKKQPDYHTAFIFIDDEYNNPQVPVWAIKLVLQSEEI